MDSKQRTTLALATLIIAAMLAPAIILLVIGWINQSPLLLLASCVYTWLFSAAGPK